MHVGFYLPTEGPFADVRLLAGLAADAEAAGWDGLFLWDELLPIFEHSDPVRQALGTTGEVADTFVALTAIAAATERIRFGALVTAVSRLRPEAFAKQTATLDRFSGGRLVVGVGLGNPPDQFRAFGGPEDIKVRAAMTDEFLEVLTALWSGEVVTFRGSYYTVEQARLAPPPLQRPRIPIWIGADSRHRAPRRRAARWDGFAPVSDYWPQSVLSVDDYRDIAADLVTLRQHAAPLDVALVGNADGTLPPVDGLDAYAAAGVTWLLQQAFTPDDAAARIRRGPPGRG